MGKGEEELSGVDGLGGTSRAVGRELTRKLQPSGGIKWLMGYRSQARQSSTLGNGTAGYDWPMTMVLRAAIVSESPCATFTP